MWNEKGKAEIEDQLRASDHPVRERKILYKKQNKQNYYVQRITWLNKVYTLFLLSLEILTLDLFTLGRRGQLLLWIVSSYVKF